MIVQVASPFFAGGFVAPCLPIAAKQPPCGPEWLIEIKHDRFRVIARKEGKRVRLYSRRGNDLIHRFPLVVEALARLRAQSCVDGSRGVRSRRDEWVYSSGRSPHCIKSKNPNKRGRSQDRKRRAGGQDHEVRYEARKTGKSNGEVKQKRAGSSRRKVEKVKSAADPGAALSLVQWERSGG